VHSIHNILLFIFKHLNEYPNHVQRNERMSLTGTHWAMVSLYEAQMAEKNYLMHKLWKPLT